MLVFSLLNPTVCRGEHFAALAASTAFHNLRKFTFRREDDDGEADLNGVRLVLDGNEKTLQHFVVNYLDESLDLAFESVTINNLANLDLFGGHVSDFALKRIADARNLRSLTLHGSFSQLCVSQIFEDDRIVDGVHTCLPRLESFGFVMEEEDHDLYHPVIDFLRGRAKLRRLDLGSCPWDMIRDILPDLKSLRAVTVCINELSKVRIKALVEALPTQLVAIRLLADFSDGLLVYILSLLMRLTKYAH
jgi:hypothetical protein